MAREEEQRHMAVAPHERRSDALQVCASLASLTLQANPWLAAVDVCHSVAYSLSAA